MQVLKDLKNGLNPTSITPGSCLSSWDFTVDPCDHIFTQRFTCGFRCDRLVSGTARITEITLDQVRYSGSLASATWNLPYLQSLDLSYNSFSGSIPGSFSNLTQLRRLSLSKNSLSGFIPDSLGALSSRRALSRYDNQITGKVPSTLPSSLVELSIRSNDLAGDVTSSLSRLVVLQVLDPSHNKLSGRVSSVVFDHPSLEQLTLSHNNFTSLEAPRNMGLDSRLIAVDLSHNKLRGLLPAFMAFMAKLSAVSLEHNEFTGMIPSQYALRAAVPGAGTSSFERLLLGRNYLFGPIPGPFMGLKPGSANVSLVDNCLYRCPDMFFFCQEAVTVLKWEGKERLISVDEAEHRLCYEIVDSNIGFNSYVSTVQILPGDHDCQHGCVIEWSFTVDPVVGWVLDDLVNKYHVDLQRMAQRMEDALAN
ncbi:hypothetical protein FNV43_RR11570 [Rhamnella rubrinervis]|uniref:Uncharacterized protein n=1 Tax=Rhamnella rubrinervis TaxID=2594499 RepID=A0A8K0MHR3_9ROSA|nr:hypothetical protein FNV43_RR11570 [Rhamnella rubrinervis]